MLSRLDRKMQFKKWTVITFVQCMYLVILDFFSIFVKIKAIPGFIHFFSSVYLTMQKSVPFFEICSVLFCSLVLYVNFDKNLVNIKTANFLYNQLCTKIYLTFVIFQLVWPSKIPAPDQTADIISLAVGTKNPVNYPTVCGSTRAWKREVITVINRSQRKRTRGLVQDHDDDIIMGLLS